jgi:hypothetical protein
VLPSHTVPVPCVEPNPEPEMVYRPAGPPGVGTALVTVGIGVTVKLVAVLDMPPTVTTEGPEATEPPPPFGRPPAVPQRSARY